MGNHQRRQMEEPAPVIPDEGSKINSSDSTDALEKTRPILKTAPFSEETEDDQTTFDINNQQKDAASEAISQCSTIFALGTAIPILYGSCTWLFLQMYAKGALSVYLIPFLKEYLKVQAKDVPNYTVLVFACLAYGASSLLSTIAKAASDEGLDYGTTRSKNYTGIVLRIVE
ncbi:UNVERIFIED_CONTAM: hypothetical protein HDU68_003887 [Siphonaria sp. JEL0065]|nr:hypothetical protein HDU68_003887 [Siphonaria sp. JEL0065]